MKQSRQAGQSLPAHKLGQPPIWSTRDARFYLEGIERSDYAQRMGPLVAKPLGGMASLLDIGAGAGTLPRTFFDRAKQWTAVEPNAYLAARLRELRKKEGFRLRVIEDVWQRLVCYRISRHDALLAANTAAPLIDPLGFWQTLAPYARRCMVWTVPAQRGPRRWCLSGALPAHLHGEDEIPAVEIVLSRLPASLQPQEVTFAEWTFHYDFSDFVAANDWFQQRFNPRGLPERRRALRAHLERTLIIVPEGVRAIASKRGACLVWKF